jgi:cyclopropane fatty-acyl-phospholipid synthase-like methyltransferase
MRDFWRNEKLRYANPHYRLEKTSQIVNKLASGRSQTLLDVGCGPAMLMRLLTPNIRYFGIDISIRDPAPNLIESDFLASPIGFDGQQFDIVVAQGVFEYMGEFQDDKFAEIAAILNPGGTFVVSYVNFGHRSKQVYRPYNNVQPIGRFRKAIERRFTIDRSFPTSHNWKHSEPNRRLLKAANMHFNVNIPVLGPALAVEYFFICSAGQPARGRP